MKDYNNDQATNIATNCIVSIFFTRVYYLQPQWEYETKQPKYKQSVVKDASSLEYEITHLLQNSMVFNLITKLPRNLFKKCTHSENWCLTDWFFLSILSELVKQIKSMKVHNSVLDWNCFQVIVYTVLFHFKRFTRDKALEL